MAYICAALDYLCRAKQEENADLPEPPVPPDGNWIIEQSLGLNGAPDEDDDEGDEDTEFDKTFGQIMVHVARST
ncbi:hypothetical protein EON81_22145 [bacterium]|nr:MAG: hypothetical protein EON81_22145 [bacterium]